MNSPKTNPLWVRVTAISIVFLALVLIPAPVLPPHRFAENIQELFQLNWKTAYLVSLIMLHVVLYGTLGVIAAFGVKRGTTHSSRILQVLIVPLVVITIGIAIRSLKLGVFPILANVIIGSVACLVGVWLGLSILYNRLRYLVLVLPVLVGFTCWGLLGGAGTTLSKLTQMHIERLIALQNELPDGEDKFEALVRYTFSVPDKAVADKVQYNRAALLALGIVLGDESIARFVGLDTNTTLFQQVATLRAGTVIRQREDWPRHFCVSAALAVLEHPVISDAGGVMKEQLDALTEGSGFSFCDVAADRAGVRFAEAATYTEDDAGAMQDFLQKEWDLATLFPHVEDLPENLTTAQFRQQFGSVGSQRYRQLTDIIETRLDSCKALSPLYTHNP